MLRTGIDQSLVADVQGGEVDPDVPLLEKKEEQVHVAVATKLVCHKGLYYPVAFSSKLRIYCPLEAGGYDNRNPRSKGFDKDKIALMTIPSDEVDIGGRHEEIGVSHETIDIIERRLPATIKYIKARQYLD